MLCDTGEKRKQKLRYLQQLIKDGSNDEQTPEPSPQQHEAHLRPLSADYEAGPSSSPFMLHSNRDFTPVTASSTAALGHGLVASTAPLDAHILPTTPAYPPFASPWSSPVYDPPPPANMTWGIPTWAPVEYSPRPTPRSDNFPLSPPIGQMFFEQASGTYHPPRQIALNSDHYGLASTYGHYNDGPQNQTPGISNVSLPASSSHFQGHFPGPH